jgi:hypothetical protein
MFEDTKVDADMAHWTYAGNLDDHAAQTARANGGWWLLKWYADLTGQTVKVTPPALNVADTLQATAAIDRDRRQATVLFGGTSDDVSVDTTQISPPAGGPLQPGTHNPSVVGTSPTRLCQQYSSPVAVKCLVAITHTFRHIF